MNHEVNRRRDELLSPLDESYLDTVGEVRDVELTKPKVNNTHADKKLVYAIDEIKSLAPRIKDRFVKLKKHAAVKWREYKSFVFHRQPLTRKAATPDPLNAIALVFAAGGVETLMAGTVYSIEGKMDIVAGLGFGAIFSFCNIAAGLMIGWAYRYAHIRYHDHFDERKVKQAAWAIIAGLVCLLIYMILTGARTRTLGDSKDIWDFSEIGLVDTFSDFIVGFTAAQKDADAIDRMGEDLAAELSEMIEDISEDAAEDFEDAQGDPEEHDEYRKRCAEVLDKCTQHNIAVRECESGLRDLYHDVVDIRPKYPTFATELPHLLIDLDEVEKKLALPDVPESSEDLLATLQMETRLALAAVQDALMDYLNANQAHDDEQEQNHA